MAVTTMRSPADQSPDQWLAAAHHAIERQVGAIAVCFDRPVRSSTDTFRLHRSHVGPVTVIYAGMTLPYQAIRTKAGIRADTAELYRVMMPLRKPTVQRVGELAKVITPGQFAIMDYAKPYGMRQMDASDGMARSHITMAVPRHLLPWHTSDIDRIAGLPIGGDQGAGMLTSTLLRQIARDMGDYTVETMTRASTALLDLLIATVTECLGEPVSWQDESHQRAVILRMRAFIDENLTHPELSAAMVSVAHHLSIRQVQRIFATQQSTVDGWIRQRRLERCRADLANPALSGRTVSEIAASWGLTDPAHFSRLFRRRYGMTPREYRGTYEAFSQHWEQGARPGKMLLS